MGATKASLAICLLLLVKDHICKAYHLDEERLAAFMSGPQARKAENKVAAIKVCRVPAFGGTQVPASGALQGGTVMHKCRQGVWCLLVTLTVDLACSAPALTNCNTHQ